MSKACCKLVAYDKSHAVLISPDKHAFFDYRLSLTYLGLRRKGASTHLLAMSTAWPINTFTKFSGKFDSLSSIL